MRGDTLQSAAESISGLKALAWILGESHHDNLIERLRNAGPENDGRLGHFLEMRGHHGVVAVGREGELAGDHFVERDAEGIKIGAIVGGVAFHLFGRHVVERAESRAGHGEAAIAGGARDAEIHQLHRAVGREHHVGGLDVAMDDVLFVGVAESVENLVDIFDRQRRGNGALMKTGGERDAVDELHNHDELIVERESGAQRGDVWMMEAGEDFDFAEESIGEILLAGEVGQKNFHGLDAVGDRVADLVDFAHASGAENAQNFIIAELLSDRVVLAHREAPFK